MKQDGPKILEACVETLEEAILAEKNGADRIELCDHLDMDGITPSSQMIREVFAGLRIPLRVMVRPRPGNFVYSRKEIGRMVETLHLCRDLGIDGVVLGLLTPGAAIDAELLRHLIEEAGPLNVTFHKAIDQTEDPLKEIERLKKIAGISAVLSSGKQRTAYEGRDLLKKMIEVADDRFKIIAAGKVTKDNLLELHRLIGAEEYHGRKIVGDLH